MATNTPQTCTAFDGFRMLASGALPVVAVAVRHAIGTGATGPLLTFDDATGKVIDLDVRGTNAEIAARHAAQLDDPRGRGRPKLGVVAREVTLLPRHWDWLAAQPGGASVALRKLVEDARRGGGGAVQRRAATDAAYRFLSALAGDLPGYEEAIRALFANDAEGFARQITAWPADVRGYAAKLAAPVSGEPAI